MTGYFIRTTVSGNCSELMRLHELFSRCHSEERSDEESTISPPPGERYREGGSSRFNSLRLNKLLPRPILSLTDKNIHPTILPLEERPRAPSTQGLSNVVRDLPFPFTLSLSKGRRVVSSYFDRLSRNGLWNGPAVQPDTRTNVRHMGKIRRIFRGGKKFSKRLISQTCASSVPCPTRPQP